MSLSDLASLGSFVSGLAVLISLIYLAVQIRQAERNQKAMIQQGRAARMVDLNLRLAEASSMETFVKGLAGEPFASNAELMRFRSIAAASLYSMEDTVLQHKSGLIGADEFEGFRLRMTGMLGGAGFRAIWNEQRLFHGRDFRDFFDLIVRTTPLAPPVDWLSRWNDAVARERGGH